jgi:hypothetical protein
MITSESSLDDVMRALVRLGKDSKARAAAMPKVVDAAAALNVPTFAFCRRLNAVLDDMSRALSEMKVPGHG